MDINHVHKLKLELDAIRSNKFATVGQYIAKFRAVVLELGIDAPAEDELRFKFLTGLEGSQLVFTRMYDSKTLLDLFANAEKVESDLSGKLSKSAHASTKSTPSTSTPMDLGTATVQESRAQSSASSSSDWKKKAVCHFCGKKGHIKPDCRSFLSSKTRDRKGKGPARVNLAQKVDELEKTIQTLSKN